MGVAAIVLTEEDLMGLVADLLTRHGCRFIPDSELADMQRALRPFLGRRADGQVTDSSTSSASPGRHPSTTTAT